MRLRTGLGALTAVAVAAILAGGGPAWRDRWDDTRDRPDVDRLARAVERADRAVRREAQDSIRYLVSGEPADRTALAAVRVATDRSLRTVRDRVADVPRTERAAVDAFVAAWSHWGTQRIGIDRRTVPDTTTLARFDALTSASAGAVDALARAPLTDTTHRTAIAQLTRARSALASEARGLTVGLARGALAPAVVTSLGGVPGALDATLTPARRLLRPAGVDFGPFDRAHARTAAVTAAARNGTVPPTTETLWERRAGAEQRGLDAAVTAALDLAAHREAADRRAAGSALRTLTLTLGAALAVAVTAGLVLDRRIRRRARTTPPPEEPASETTAGAPADPELLVTLVRRNRPLLERQQRLLADLDLAARADEQPVVSEVDRLARRMRRHGDSLVVLAERTPERATTGAAPLRDVVRDAVAEVTHYSRVDVVGLPPDVAVAGPAVADVVHLLAELLDNGRVFSGSEAPVRVVARRIDAGLELAVVDHGIGMAGPDLDRWNRVLATPGDAPAAPGPIGLAVVGRLAARLGASVTLHSRPDRGTCAVVTIPASLLQRSGAAAPEAGASDTAPGATVDHPGGTAGETLPGGPVQFTAAPQADPGHAARASRHVPGRRRPRHRSSTGRLHRAPPTAQPPSPADGPAHR